MKQGERDYGSQHWLRVAVNETRDIIDRELSLATQTESCDAIEWVSPLKPEYTEYHDQEFLDRLRITLPKVTLKDFWPNGGPVWDGLARTDSNRIFLVEAKAHIPEVNSPASGASLKSLKRIAKSLNRTRAFLNADPLVDWTRAFFQYTNRIAHLYLLRELNDVDTYLINVYFLNDTVMDGPTSIEEWRGSLTLLKTYLGVTGTKLSPFMKDLFLDVNKLGRSPG